MSFTIDQIKQEYQRLDRLCGADISRVPIRISKRAVHQHGACHLSGNPQDPVRAISIASFIMDGDDEAVFLNTIRHEYAHALVAVRYPYQQHRHDVVWKAACREVGCSDNRCATASEEYTDYVRNHAKYTVTCSRCHQRWHFFRAGKIVSRLKRNPQYRGASCPICGCSQLVLTEAK